MTTHQKLVDAYFEEVAPYWRDVYRGEDVQSIIYERRREAVLASIDGMSLPAGSRILESGCGAGLTTIALARKGYDVVATDSVAKMLDMTRELAQYAGVAGRVSLQTADINHLQFADQSFEAAAAIGVLPWLSSLEEPVREIARVLKPGGYLVITVDNVLALHRLLDPRLCPAVEPFKRVLRKLLDRFGCRKPLPCARTHSMRQLDRAIRRAGLKRLSGSTIGFGPFTFWNRHLLSMEQGHRWNGKLQRLAGAGSRVLRSTGAHYLVVAQKPRPEKTENTHAHQTHAHQTHAQ